MIGTKQPSSHWESPCPPPLSSAHMRRWTSCSNVIPRSSVRSCRSIGGMCTGSSALSACSATCRRDVAVPLGVAGFFHDAGIWFDGTWDYLPPSVKRATAELSESDAQHVELVSSLISEHHRMRKARHDNPFVEAFRRADLADVSAGLVGVPGATRAQYQELVAEYPANGFRPMLMKAFGRGLKESPVRPMPMMKF
jgi:hypothetical protein